MLRSGGHSPADHYRFLLHADDHQSHLFALFEREGRDYSTVPMRSSRGYPSYTLFEAPADGILIRFSSLVVVMAFF